MAEYDYEDSHLMQRHITVRAGSLLHRYYMPGDRAFLGGWAGKLYLLWLIVVPMLLTGFLQLFYILQWQFLVTIILSWIEAGLVLIGSIAFTVLAVWSDDDIHRLTSRAAEVKVSYIVLADAKRSRNNAAADLSLFLYNLLWCVFEISMVMLYWLGGTGNNWLNAHETAINYPITNSTQFPVMTGFYINQVLYRSFIHLFIFIKALVLFGGVLYTRVEALELHHAVKKIYLEGDGDLNAPAPSDTVVRLGNMPTKSVAAPAGGNGGYLVHA